MPVGLAVPMRAGPTGRSVLSRDDEQADKIIRLALGNGDNDNAFQQDVALGVAPVFAVNNPGVRGRVLARLLKLFDEFERRKLFKLVRSSIRWEKRGGDLILRFKYRNLRSDEVVDFSTHLGPGGGGL